MDFQAEFQPTEDTAAFRLRPLTTGEVFDRTFSLYRQNFWLFAGISLMPAIVQLIGGILRIIIMRAGHVSPVAGMFGSPALIAFSVTWWFVGMAAYGSSQAASTLAVSAVYLGRPVTMTSVYRESASHWLRYPILILAQFLSAGGLAAVASFVMIAIVGGAFGIGFISRTAMTALVFVAMFVGFIFAFHRYLRVSLAMPASVVEDLQIRAALKRSRALTLDRKMRIFLIFILLGILYSVAGTAVALLTTAALGGKMPMLAAQAGSLLTSFIASLILQPIGAIALCLFYFDERVRREGFDIEFMLQNAGAPMGLSDTAEPLPDATGV